MSLIVSPESRWENVPSSLPIWHFGVIWALVQHLSYPPPCLDWHFSTGLLYHTGLASHSGPTVVQSNPDYQDSVNPVVKESWEVSPFLNSLVFNAVHLSVQSGISESRTLLGELFQKVTCLLQECKGQEKESYSCSLEDHPAFNPIPYSCLYQL